MNLQKTPSLENALEKNYPVWIVFETDSKEIVEWWPFGEGLAKGSAEIRNNKHGPETHDYAIWENYVQIRDKHNKHLKQLEEIESRL